MGVRKGNEQDRRRRRGEKDEEENVRLCRGAAMLGGGVVARVTRVKARGGNGGRKCRWARRREGKSEEGQGTATAFLKMRVGGALVAP